MRRCGRGAGMGRPGDRAGGAAPSRFLFAFGFEAAAPAGERAAGELVRPGLDSRRGMGAQGGVLGKGCTLATFPAGKQRGMEEMLGEGAGRGALAAEG